MEKIQKFEGKVTHLAGIIPVAAPPLEFNLPWHDCMMPISPNYLAVERSVMECVDAGCSTIWIVCHMGMQPLLRKRIGDMVLVKEKSLKRENNKAEERVNVFYVPIHPKDRDKRDSLGWSVLYGADKAFRICSFISKWIAPERYYCSFPYGVLPNEYIKSLKLRFKLGKKIVLSFNNQTVKDGIPLSFSFDALDYKRSKENLYNLTANTFRIDGDPLSRIDYKKSRDFSLKQIFTNLDFSDVDFIEVPWYYDISTWKGYSSFISSGIHLDSPREFFIKHTREKVENGLLNE